VIVTRRVLKRFGVELDLENSGTMRTIDTDTNLPSGDSPPTMQPR
jgi:hypothetical protein